MQQFKNCCKRTEESTTLDPQWLHQSLPSCTPLEFSLEGLPHPITEISPQLKFLQQSLKVSTTSYHNPGRNLSLTTTCSPYKIDDLSPSIPWEIPLMCMTFSSTSHHDHIFHMSINMSLWISTYYSLQWIQIKFTLTRDSYTKIDFSLCFVMCDA